MISIYPDRDQAPSPRNVRTFRGIYYSGSGVAGITSTTGSEIGVQLFTAFETSRIARSRAQPGPGFLGVQNHRARACTAPLLSLSTRI